jgi:predicted GNAT family N-acyltransferase
MDVRQIDSKDTLELRSIVLREGRPLEECHFENDDKDQTFHLGAFIDEKLVSVASFYLEKHPELPGDYHYRLRGMATAQDFRGQGLSSALLRTAFPLIKKNSVNLVWCNARSSATGFYHKVGFELVGEEFDIAGVGPHYMMFINI